MSPILLEPCCAPRIWKEIFAKLTTDKTVAVSGYGDTTWAEVLPYVCSHETGADWLLVLPQVEPVTLSLLQTLMAKTVAVRGGNAYSISGLSIVTDARNSKSPALTTSLPADRTVIANCPLLTSFLRTDGLLIFGHINQRPDRPWTAIVTTDSDFITAATSQTVSLLRAFRMK